MQKHLTRRIVLALTGIMLGLLGAFLALEVST